MEVPSDSSQAGQIVRSTLIVSGGWGASILVGLLRQRIVGQAFGTGSELDAFTAANVVPELLFTMLSGGALSFAFIPIYTEFLSKRSVGEANRLVSQVINLILLITGLASLVVAVIAPTLVSAPWGVGARFAPEIQVLTTGLMRLLLISTVIFAVSSILTGILYAHQHFVLPALIPSLYSGGIIIGAWLLSPQMGVFGIAWGAIIGASLHFLIQLPGIFYYGVRWKPLLGFDSGMRRVFILMAPRVVDLLMARASINWLNASLASRLEEGRLTALDFAFRLMNMPWTLIGTAIGIAIFPTLAALAAQNDLKAQREALSGALRAILTLAVPAALGLILLGRPLIRLLFEGGEFTPESTELVFYALRFYALALISQSMLEVVVRAFAAQQDTYTPLFVSVFTTALNIGLAIWWSQPFARGGIEHGGPALANGVAVLVEAMIGLTILHIRWKGVDARRIIADSLKALAAAGVLAGVVLGFKALIGESLLLIVLGGGLGMVAYFIVAFMLGIKEIRDIPLGLINNAKPIGKRT